MSRVQWEEPVQFLNEPLHLITAQQQGASEDKGFAGGVYFENIPFLRTSWQFQSWPSPVTSRGPGKRGRVRSARYLFPEQDGVC